MTRLTATNAFMASPSSDRIPRGQLHRGHVLEEAGLERGHGLVGDGFGRPAVTAMHRSHHADLAEEIDLVGAHAEDLARYMGRALAGKVDGQRGDLGALHLLE